MTIKIVSIEHISLAEPVEVGDIEIDDSEEHSFIVAGVEVHNSNECLSNHGNKTFPPDTPEFPPWHPRCRSSQNPVYRDQGELNVPENGDAWLRTQSADTQREVLGPARYNAWRSGSLKVEPGELTKPDGTDYTLKELRRRGVNI